MAGTKGVEGLRNSIQDASISNRKPRRFHYQSPSGDVIHVLDVHRFLKPNLTGKAEGEIIPVVHPKDKNNEKPKES